MKICVNTEANTEFLELTKTFRFATDKRENLCRHIVSAGSKWKGEGKGAMNRFHPSLSLTQRLDQPLTLSPITDGKYRYLRIGFSSFELER